MDAHDNIVAGLVEFYTAPEIRRQWEQVHASLGQRARETVTVVGKTVDGRTTTAASLSTPEEKHAYIAACRDALARIEGRPATTGAPTQNDFSGAAVLV